MEEHRRHDRDRQNGQYRTLNAKRYASDRHDLRVVSEKGDDLRGKEEAAGGNKPDERCPEPKRKEGSLLHTGILFRTVIEGGDGLKALPDPEPDTENEARRSADVPHRGDRGVSERLRLQIQNHRRNAVESLPRKARKSHYNNVQKGSEVRHKKTAKRDSALGLAKQKYRQKDREGDVLRQCGRESRACDLHIKSKDKQRVKQNVQNAARRESDHRKKRLALVAKDVIQYTARRHRRSREEDVKRVIHRVRQDGLCAAEQSHQGLEEDEPDRHNDGAANKGVEEAHRRVFTCLFRLPFAKQTADIAPRPVSEHKSERL